MNKRFKTYGGVLRWNHQTEEVYQTRCLNPPTYNAQFKDKIRQEYPEYTLIEEWKV